MSKNYFAANAMKQLTRQKRIIGDALSLIDGKTVIERFPFMASLQVTIHGHICGGSIISHYHVITAADCMRANYDTGKYEKKFWVRVGSANNFYGGSKHRVKNWTVHPGNNTKNTTYRDFALLKLEDPIEYNDETKSIALFGVAEEIKNRSRAWSAGWGCTNEKPFLFMEYLLNLDMEIIVKKDCNVMNNKSRGLAVESTRKDIDLGLKENEICAESVSTNYAWVRSLCKYDEGGPLVIDGKLAGVAVRIMKYRKKRWYTVFIEIAPHEKWINEQLAL